jgi:hypothetical protein
MNKIVNATTLATVTPIDMGDYYPYVWLKNNGDADVYASAYSDMQGGGDNTADLKAGSAVRIEAQGRYVYVQGVTDIEAHGQDHADCPFDLAVGGGGSEANIQPLSVFENGTYTASGSVDGYSPVSVALDTSFYPKTDCELIDVTGVESDTMRVIPTVGTDYYPYVYLASKPYPGQTGDEWVPCNKRYDGQTQEHTVGLFIMLMDAATGEAVSGYPQQISQTTYSIVDGGYCRIKNWTVSANGSQVSVTITRNNPTYTKPIDTTLGSAAVPTGALDTYLTKPYKVEINKDNTAYTAVSAYWTDFVIAGASTGGEALNNVVAVKIAATEAIPAGTKIVLRNSTTTEYTLTQGLQRGDAVTWADNAITPIIAEVQWSISVDKADGTDWYAPPFTFTLFKEV